VVTPINLTVEKSADFSTETIKKAHRAPRLGGAKKSPHFSARQKIFSPYFLANA